MGVRQNPDKITRIAEKFRQVVEESDVEWDAIGIVMIAIEVRDFPVPEEDEPGSGDVQVYCTDPRPWVQSAFLSEAKQVVDEHRFPTVWLDEEEDEE